MPRTLLLIGLTAIYAVCFALIKTGLAFAPPLLFGGLRALIGGAALFLVLLAQGRPLRPPPGTGRGLLVLALTSTTLSFGAMFLSPGRTGAGIASVLGNTQPLVVVGLAALCLGEPMTRRKWLTLGLGLTGVLLISWQALAEPNGSAASGAALALTASTSAAIGTVIFKRMGVNTGLLAVTAWQLVLGSLPLLSASALVEPNASIIWSRAFILDLLFLALVGTAFAYAAWFWLVQRGEVSHLSLHLFLVPVFGLGLAALALGEPITWLEGIGSLLTILGVGLISQPTKDRSKTALTV